MIQQFGKNYYGLHEVSAPPVKKSKISKQEQEQLMAMYNLLPKEAQKEGYEGLSKS